MCDQIYQLLLRKIAMELAHYHGQRSWTFADACVTFAGNFIPG